MGENADPVHFMTARQLAERTGFSVRFFQDLAASGKCDWAFQPTGERGRWRFRADGFEKWWQAGVSTNRKPRERKSWRRSTREARGSGGRSNATANPFVSHLEQKIEKLLNSGSKQS